MIKLVGVKKTLGGQPVLQGVDLVVPPGKLTTIIGRSGEGKSVLLKHMIGLLQPDEGEVWVAVWVAGTEISRLKGHALNEVRKRFAMLFQGAALFDSLTVFENVAFPLREKLRMKGASVTTRVEEKVYGGILKSISFGLIVSWVCCYKGFYTRMSAEGLGTATTEAVVLSSVLILVWDYFLTSVLL
ncbi:MAG: ATP-binding cassette domain-containing protein [Nitrospira sp.]|nr:ATP-binding cassette domain-containing protein [Nitrospira sp.]